MPTNKNFWTWDLLPSKIMSLKSRDVYCVISAIQRISEENKLKRHLETKHPQQVKKNCIFFF